MRSAIVSSGRSCWAAKRSEVGEAGHRAVVVDELAEHAGGVEAGEAREVDGGLGVAGALEHAAALAAQREDVARAAQVVGRGVGVDEHLDRARAVGGGDAGGGAVAGVDGEREGGAHGLAAVVAHQGQLELLEPFAFHRDAHDPGAVADHEREGLGRGALGGHDQVALVLAILVVDDDDHAAAADRLDCFLDARAHADLLKGARRPLPPVAQPPPCGRRNPQAVTTGPVSRQGASGRASAHELARHVVGAGLRSWMRGTCSDGRMIT